MTTNNPYGQEPPDDGQPHPPQQPTPYPNPQATPPQYPQQPPPQQGFPPPGQAPPGQSPPGGFPPPGQNPPGGFPPPGQNPPGGFPPPGQNPSAGFPPQQPQYASPGQFPGYPPAQVEPKKSRKWLWFLIGIPLLLLLGIGGCTVLLFSTLSGPVDATNAFVAELDDGDFAAAYEQLCSQTRNNSDAGQWASEVEAGLGGEITGFSFTQASISSSTGSLDTATVSGTIEVDGVDRTVTYGLVKENDEWRVCSAGT